MKIYLDDIRNTPEGWTRAYSVNQAIILATAYPEEWEAASLDHDLGDYAGDGGDAIKFVDWMAENQCFPKIVYLHTSNPVGRANMERTLIRQGFEKRGLGLYRGDD